MARQGERESVTVSADQMDMSNVGRVSGQRSLKVAT